MSAEERLKWLNDQLDKFEQSIGLPVYVSSNEDYRKYLNLSNEQLRELTSEECREGAYLLSDYAYHVNKQFNRENARAGWCEREIWRTIAPHLDDYKTAKYQSNDEVKNLAILGNEYAEKLHRLQGGCSARAEQLRDISKQIDKIADRLSSLAYSKAQR